MSRIAFAWEFGAGLGHIQYDLPLARKLMERGHEVFCVMRNVIGAEKILGPFGIKILQAPSWQLRRKRQTQTYHFIEILFDHGYLFPGALLGMTKAWHNLFSILAPDLVVIDYAPTALLALRNSNIKKILYGTGFTIPPRQTPVPSIIPWSDPPVGHMQRCESQGLQLINSVLNQTGGPPLERLCDLFDAEEDILATFKELDHFQNREPTRHWGAVLSPPGGFFPDWPALPASKKRVFCYLKATYPAFEFILGELQRVEAAIIVFANGISKKQVQKFQSANIRFTQVPVDMHRACMESNAIVCHAGHGTTAMSLLKGKPLVLLPELNHLEQILTARNVENLKAGKTLTGKYVKSFKQTLESVLFEEESADRAEQFAGKYADFDPELQLEEIVERCEEILRRG